MRTPRAIAAQALITATEVLAKPLILLRDGVIERVTSQGRESAPEGTLHLTNSILSAGLLDLHIHGAGGADVMDDADGAVSTVGEMLARRGTTEYLPTTITAPIEATLRALERLANAIEGAPPASAAKPIGIHLEGPFLSHAKRGVHPPAHLQAPSMELFDSMWQAARGHVRMMTVAPELPGATEMIAYATGLGVRVSLGHSTATAAEARAGFAAGAVSATHTYNAMRPLDHREPGILGVVLDHRETYADLICDGVHVAPEAVRLWWRAKGPDRAILITDGMAATGMPDGHYRLGDLDVEVAAGVCMRDGVLAGSVLTMDRAVMNLQHITGADLPAAVRAASSNPSALLLGARSNFRLQAGAPANLCVWGRSGRMTGTVLRGCLLA